MKAHPPLLALLLAAVAPACNDHTEAEAAHSENWAARVTTLPTADTLLQGRSYLSIYAQIYSSSQHKTHDLTAMASLRNVSPTDTVYVTRADFYDTHGRLLKQYIDRPVYLAPLETADIIIDEADVAGGTGANFLFDWRTPRGCPPPLFEGIMNSTVGQQGLSFTTQAVRVE